MVKVGVRRFVYPVLVAALLIGVAYWVLNVRKINDKIPARGVFVYSKEFYSD
ncbi:MAG: hypothetical protein AB7G87_10445 [Clostridia bacterium]